MPNAIQTVLKIVAKLCDDNLACPESLHDTANLAKAVNDAANSLEQRRFCDQAKNLCRCWGEVCRCEDDIDSYQFIGSESELRSAWQSWRERMTQLRDTALKLAQSVGEIAEEQGEEIEIAAAGQLQNHLVDFKTQTSDGQRQQTQDGENDCDEPHHETQRNGRAANNYSDDGAASNLKIGFAGDVIEWQSTRYTVGEGWTRAFQAMIKANGQPVGLSNFIGKPKRALEKLVRQHPDLAALIMRADGNKGYYIPIFPQPSIG